MSYLNSTERNLGFTARYFDSKTVSAFFVIKLNFTFFSRISTILNNYAKKKFNQITDETYLTYSLNFTKMS